MHAQVMDYEIDPSFDSSLLFSKGSVSDIELRTSGEALIVGNFNNPSSDISSGAILNESGGLVIEMNYGGPGAIPYLNSYLQHGSVLRMYNESGINNQFYFEFRKAAYSGFVPDQETCGLVLSEDNILVGGIFFTDSLDLTANSLRQLCMIDGTGAPIEGFPMVKCEPFDARIYTIDTLSTGEYIIAGSFTHVNGHPTNNIAKLNADFSVDTEFESVLVNQGTAFTQLIDSQDRIWAIIGNGHLIDFPDSQTSLFRVSADGFLDNAFEIPIIQRVNDNNDLVQSYSSILVEDEDGRFIVAGFFNQYNGVDKNGLIKIEDDGALIEEAFDGMGTDEAIWGSYTEYAGITTIKQLPDGKILLGGRFSSFGGESYSCLVRLQPSGFVGLNDIEGRGKLKLYPNPAQNTVRIEVPDKNEQVSQIEIFDLSGRLVKSQSLNTLQAVIDVSDLHRGLYLVKAKTDSGVYSQTLVLQ